MIAFARVHERFYLSVRKTHFRVVPPQRPSVDGNAMNHTRNSVAMAEYIQTFS